MPVLNTKYQVQNLYLYDPYLYVPVARLNKISPCLPVKTMALKPVRRILTFSVFKSILVMAYVVREDTVWYRFARTDIICTSYRCTVYLNDTVTGTICREGPEPLSRRDEKFYWWGCTTLLAQQIRIITVVLIHGSTNYYTRPNYVMQVLRYTSAGSI